MIEVPPPAELSELVQAIGPEAVLRLIEARGGTRVYVPEVVGEDAPLARDIGRAAAEALSAAKGRGEFKVPLAKVWRARLYRARGDSYATIARKLGVGESAVWNMLHHDIVRERERQLTLL